MKLYEHRTGCQYADDSEDFDPFDCEGCKPTCVEMSVSEALAAHWRLDCRGCGLQIYESGEDDEGEPFEPVEHVGEPYHSPACLAADLADRAESDRLVAAVRARILRAWPDATILRADCYRGAGRAGVALPSGALIDVDGDKAWVSASWESMFPDAPSSGLTRAEMKERILSRLDLLVDEIHTRWAAAADGMVAA